MNKKMKFDIEQLRGVLQILSRLRGLITALAVVGAIGYTSYQVSQVYQTHADQAAIDDGKQQLSLTRVKFDQKTINTLNSLLSVNVSVDLSHVGKSNPFQ